MTGLCYICGVVLPGSTAGVRCWVTGMQHGPSESELPGIRKSRGDKCAKEEGLFLFSGGTLECPMLLSFSDTVHSHGMTFLPAIALDGLRFSNLSDVA